jgi:phosphoketolase
VPGPGQGGPALVANVYLDGTYSEAYPDVSQDEAGLWRLVRQFSTPQTRITNPGGSYLVASRARARAPISSPKSRSAMS